MNSAPLRERTEPRQRAGYILALTATVFLSFTGILIAAISRRHQAPALVIAIWRDVFTFGALAIFLAFRAPRLLRIDGADLAFLIANGGVLAIFNIFWTLSVVRNGAAAATLLAYSSGGFTVLLSVAIFGEKAGIAKLLAVIGAFAGAALVSGLFSGAVKGAEGVGILLGLASGLAYAAYSLVGKGASIRGISPWTTVCYSFGIAALFLLGARIALSGLLPSSATGPGQLLLPGRAFEAWLLLLLLAFAPTALGFGLYNASLAHLPAGTANLIATSEPVFTGIMAFFLLGERFDRFALLGAALILGSVLLLSIVEGRVWKPRKDAIRRRT